MCQKHLMLISIVQSCTEFYPYDVLMCIVLSLFCVRLKSPILFLRQSCKPCYKPFSSSNRNNNKHPWLIIMASSICGISVKKKDTLFLLVSDWLGQLALTASTECWRPMFDNQSHVTMQSQQALEQSLTTYLSQMSENVSTVWLN